MTIAPALERLFARDGFPGSAVLEALPDAILLVDTAGLVAFTNGSAENLFGRGTGRVVGQSISTLIPSRYRRDHAKHVHKYFQDPKLRPMGRSLELVAVNGEGHEFPVDINLSPVRFDGNTFICVVVRDISERVSILKELKNKEQRLRALFDNNPCILLILDRSMRICEINKYGREYFSGIQVDPVGTALIELVYVEDRPAALTEFDKAFRNPGDVSQMNVRVTKEIVDDSWLRLMIRVSNSMEGEEYALAVGEDVTKPLQLSRKLSYQATHDQLTGLINRFGFEQRMTALAESNVIAEFPHTLCFIDLDQFKIVNDTCGHLAGDQLLIEVAKALRGFSRKGDIVARLGGDEFAVVYENCDYSRAQKLVERTMEYVQSNRFNWDDYTFAIGMSVGLVEFDSGASGLDDVLKKADAACYAAKEKGRGRLQRYEEHDGEMRRARSDMQWAARLQRALDEDEFELWGQPIEPIMACEPGLPKIEILIRLKAEDGRRIDPENFLPAAEKFGFSGKIDIWVVRNTLRWLDGLPLGTRPECSINLSGQSIGDPKFSGVLCAILSGHEAAHAHLIFEITETAAISNLPNALSLMAQLRQFGCRFALDDFGSGMSSFAYLKNIPAEFIKIDGRFIKNVRSDRLDYMIVQSITDIARTLGKQTIAEFVESASITKALRKIGVDFVQGYGVGRPCPLSQYPWSRHITPVWAERTRTKGRGRRIALR